MYERSLCIIRRVTVCFYTFMMNFGTIVVTDVLYVLNQAFYCLRSGAKGVGEGAISNDVDPCRRRSLPPSSPSPSRRYAG